MFVYKVSSWLNLKIGKINININHMKMEIKYGKFSMDIRDIVYSKL